MRTPLHAPRRRALGWLIVRAVPLLNAVRPRAPWLYPLAALRGFPAGTLGAKVARFLDARGLDLLPNYAAHDVAHVLLGYDTTVEGELRLQAFRAGNGTSTVAGAALLALGAVVLPEAWPALRTDFARGRRAPPVRDADLPRMLWRLAE